MRIQINKTSLTVFKKLNSYVFGVFCSVLCYCLMLFFEMYFSFVNFKSVVQKI